MGVPKCQNEFVQEVTELTKVNLSYRACPQLTLLKVLVSVISLIFKESGPFKQERFLPAIYQIFKYLSKTGS